MKFVDRVRIVARAGKGGPGACSFLREKNMPDGGPDGGNGGRGGSVVIVVDPHVNNLTRYKYSPHQFAKNGENGGKKQMSGKSGADCIISVPPGTVVSRIPDALIAQKARGPALSIPQSVYSSSAILQRPRSRSSSLAHLASDAEAQATAAQIRAAQANKDALEAIARAASARAAAATALAAEAQRAVSEASRVADAVRRAYETAPASVGPTQHALPETHPSMDFPRSHVIRRAA